MVSGVIVIAEKKHLELYQNSKESDNGRNGSAVVIQKMTEMKENESNCLVCKYNSVPIARLHG